MTEAPLGNDPGEITLDGARVAYHFAGYPGFTLALDEIAIVGELVTEEFPADTVYCVLVCPDGTWQEVP